MTFKVGYAAIIGRPNVGKSTLVNTLMGQKIAPVSPRPQTTRRKQLGILTLENAQVVLVDTPGLHIPRHKLGESMNQAAANALQDCDLIVWMVDASAPPGEEDELIARRLKALKKSPPVLLALNKIDLISAELLGERQAAYLARLPAAIPLGLSALRRQGCPELLEAILARLPEGEPFYDEEQVTDLYEREIAAELVREAALVLLRQEIPHALAVRIDEFTERGDSGAYIAATLLVERETQKGIVIGKGGEMLKKIGSTARQQIEAMSGRKVFLELRVKVEKDWRNNPSALRRLGYSQPKEG